MRHGDTADQFEIRKKMIREQIWSRGVRNFTVLKALKVVPRHRFVDENLETAAYDDTPLYIGEEQTISQPFIVAYMTEALQLKGPERVLEVGTGSGYQAAILAEIVAEVFTVEINENLAIEASRRFKKMGYDNIHLRFADGYLGLPDEAPFDGIVVTAAPDHIPRALIEQLKPNGRLVIPVGKSDQELLVVKKLADGKVKKEARLPVRFVPMIREAEKKNSSI
ncbi:protein-L-isoaspartate(D-aspartate) O-methyltransferase [bacterium]|nr:protein-L-isoaspartate(D-aspartate) O-methyltransferase [bacterium]